jgi:predicted ATP-dependent endonuclease of OLD family
MLNFDPLTVLIGPNGSGKSCFLRTIDLFYNPSAEYDEDDFYEKDKDIVVTVTFANLTPDEETLFKIYVEGGLLTVEKVMSWPPTRTSQKYYGTSLRNSDFEGFRSAKGASALRSEYQTILQKYDSFPPYSTKDEVEALLSQWEASHPEQCQRVRDEGQFFGFKEVGETRLEKFTRYIPVPAVRDATQDAVEGRRAAVSEIVDLVVRNELAQKKEYVELQQETARRYRGVLPDLGKVSKRLTETIQQFVPDSQVNLEWQDPSDLSLPSPTVDTKLMENGHLSPVSKTGHGLQRAFILTMLQQLTLTQAMTPESQLENDATKTIISAPNLIIGIEEPELYQHPDRQRHFSKTLSRLSSGKVAGVAERMQVIYSTHSPLFVDLERFEQLRMFRKLVGDVGKPKHTNVTWTTIESIVRDLEIAKGMPKGTYSKESLKPHLQVLMTPWFNEGFFAKLVVLVEGITDRGTILGVALSVGSDLESRGVSVIPYNSKFSLIYALLIFRSLSIPVYGIWDSDFKSKSSQNIECNRTLLKSFDKPEEDYPEIVSDDFAVFKTNLRETFRTEVGTQFYDQLLQDYLQRLELGDENKVMGNPSIVRDFYDEIRREGNSSKTIESIVSEIEAKLG